VIMGISQLISKFTRGGPRLEDADNLNRVVDSILYAQVQITITADTVLDQNYSGRTLLVNAAGNVNLTLNSNIKKGFQCNILQLGAGTATVVAGAGVTITNKSTFTKTSGQWAMIGLVAYSDNNLVLFGDGQ
jgi:hypothetical protein